MRMLLPETEPLLPAYLLNTVRKVPNHTDLHNLPTDDHVDIQYTNESISLT